jgi:hypothetical protein
MIEAVLGQDLVDPARVLSQYEALAVAADPERLVRLYRAEPALSRPRSGAASWQSVPQRRQGPV